MTAELIERLLEPYSQTQSRRPDVERKAALAIQSRDERIAVLELALVQAAVPLEGLLMSRKWLSLANETWAEIENGVKHIRASLTPQEPKIMAGDLSKYDAESLPEHLRWKGEGPPPASWYVGNTKVYRSYADYCDD